MNLNPDNYGSLEACEKLFKAGIVMETEKVWIYARHIPLKRSDFCWRLFNRDSLMAIEATEQKPSCIIPAPSMAEVWRELPKGDDLLSLIASWMAAITGMLPNDQELKRLIVGLINDIDKTIDLLIWVSQRKEGT